MQNWRQTVLSQYASSPKLMSLLTAIDAWISPDANFENFYDLVWNVDTAEGWGLDNWGRIVVIPRTISGAAITTFGFGEATDRAPFGYGPFYEAGIGLITNYTLTDDVYRQLILAKAAYNITDGSTPAINAILMNVLFPFRGNAWVTDGANALPAFFGFGEPGDRLPFGLGPFCDLLLSPAKNMTLTYVFTFPLHPYEVAVVQSGVLPKPTGVQANWSFLGGVLPN